MKRKPIPKPSELIPHFKQILLVLTHGNAHLNHIFEQVSQTGLRGLAYKSNILAAINYLQKGGLIEDVAYSIQSKQIKQLTGLGRELTELIDNVDQYYKAFSRLREKMRENFDLSPITVAKDVQEEMTKKKIHRRILQGRGLSDELIDRYEELYYKAFALRVWLSPSSIFNIITMGYVSLISKYTLNNSEIRKDVLKGIVMDSISEHLSFLFKDLDDYNSLLEKNQHHQRFTADSELSRIIEDTFAGTVAIISTEKYLNNAFVEREALAVLSSIITISKLSPEFVEDEIKSLIVDVESCENKEYKTKQPILELIEQDRKLLLLYKKYAMKNKE